MQKIPTKIAMYIILAKCWRLLKLVEREPSGRKSSHRNFFRGQNLVGNSSWLPRFPLLASAGWAFAPKLMMLPLSALLVLLLGSLTWGTLAQKLCWLTQWAIPAQFLLIQWCPFTLSGERLQQSLLHVLNAHLIVFWVCSHHLFFDFPFLCTLTQMQMHGHRHGSPSRWHSPKSKHMANIVTGVTLQIAQNTFNND